MDWQSIQPLFTWLSEHPAWSGLFVFLIALSESLFIIGLLVPGTVLMFGVGALVGTGVLGFQETLIVAFVGAVLGDSISFWIGSRYHQQLSSVWPIKNNPGYLDGGKRFFTKHGGKSVLFGRFVGPIRPVIPAVAGMMGMSGKFFLFVNVLSAAAWAPFYLLPGIVFGTSVGLASIVGTRLVILLLILFISVLLLVWLIRKIINAASPITTRFYLKCYRLASEHPNFGKVIKAIIDAETAEKHGLYLFSILIVAVLSMLTLIIFQFSGTWLSHINNTVANFMLLIRIPVGDQLMLVFWEFVSSPVLAITLSMGVGLLLIHRYIFAVKHFLLLIVMVLLSSLLLAWIVEKSTQHGGEFSDLIFLAFLSSLVFLAAVVTQGRNIVWRWSVLSVMGLVILLDMVTELYFNQVMLSQLLASISIACVWCLLVITAYRRHSKPIQHGNSIVISMLLIFIVVGAFWTNSHYETDLELLAVKHEKISIKKQVWESENFSEQVIKRKDLFGNQKQTMNIQWVGEISDIKRSLIESNWREPLAANYRSILFWLKPDVTIHELPHIPQTHNGQVEALTMIQFESSIDYVYILQLWPSKYTIEESNDSLWTGSIAKQKISDDSKWLPFLVYESLTSSELIEFQNAMSDSDVRYLEKFNSLKIYNE